MSLVIERIDKSKGKVTQPKELNEIHKGVLEILDTKKFSEQSKEGLKKQTDTSTRSVPTLSSLRLQDALLSGKTQIIRNQINPMQEGVKKKMSVSEIIDRIVNIKIIDEAEALKEQKRYRKNRLIMLIKKINYFVLNVEASKETYDEIMSEISEAMLYLNLTCDNVDELCNCRNYLSRIRIKLTNIYGKQYGVQKVR